MAAVVASLFYTDLPVMVDFKRISSPAFEVSAVLLDI